MTMKDKSEIRHLLGVIEGVSHTMEYDFREVVLDATSNIWGILAKDTKERKDGQGEDE